MKKFLSLAFSLLFSIVSYAHDFAVPYDFAVPNADGVTIYYAYANNGTELAVTSGKTGTYYSGSIVIPAEVTYMNRTRKVTRIGGFEDCRNLTSVTIPNTVNTIVYKAFYG